MRKRNTTEWLSWAAWKIARVAGFISYICLVGMLLVIIINVLMRYILDNPFSWGDEVAVMLMVLTAYSGFGIALLKGKHIRVTAFFSMMPRKMQNVLWIISCLIGIFYISYLSVAIARLTLNSFDLGHYSQNSGMLFWPWQLLMFLGTITFIVAILIFLIRRVSIALGWREEELEEGAIESDSATRKETI